MCHKQSEILSEKGLINPARSLHEAIFIWRAQKTPSQGKKVQTCIIIKLKTCVIVPKVSWRN